MGSVAIARGVRDGYPQRPRPPDHPPGGDVVTAGGASRRGLRIAEPICASSDVDRQVGTPLTFTKVIAEKPGFTFDNPPDLHDVRASALASNRTLQYGVSARPDHGAYANDHPGQFDRLPEPRLRIFC